MLQYVNQPYKPYSNPVEGQTLLVQDQQGIDVQGYQLSVRNYKNFYEVPIEKEKVYLNFTAKKTFVSDSQLNQIGSNDFIFFIDRLPPPDDPFTLPHGAIYRCANESLKDLRNYKYYYYDDGVGREIPNYKTVEVMLSLRGISYTSVKVIEGSDCSEIPKGLIMPDLSSQWNSNLGAVTGYASLINLGNNVNTLNNIVSQLSNSTATQQQMVQNNLAAQAASMQASAAQAQAQASAAQAQANAAAASATAAQTAQTSALATAVAAQIALTQAQQQAQS